MLQFCNAINTAKGSRGLFVEEFTILILNQDHALSPELMSAIRRALVSMPNLRKLVALLTSDQMITLLREVPNAFQLSTFVSPFYSFPEYFAFLCSQRSITNITFIGNNNGEGINALCELAADADFLPAVEYVSGNYLFPMFLAPGRPLQNVVATWQESRPSLSLLFSILPQSSRSLLSLTLGDTPYQDGPNGWELLESLRHTEMALSLRRLRIYENRSVCTPFLAQRTIS